MRAHSRRQADPAAAARRGHRPRPTAPERRSSLFCLDTPLQRPAAAPHLRHRFA